MSLLESNTAKSLITASAVAATGMAYYCCMDYDVNKYLRGAILCGFPIASALAEAYTRIRAKGRYIPKKEDFEEIPHGVLAGGLSAIVETVGSGTGVILAAMNT